MIGSIMLVCSSPKVFFFSVVSSFGAVCGHFVIRCCVSAKGNYKNYAWCLQLQSQIPSRNLHFTDISALCIC